MYAYRASETQIFVANINIMSTGVNLHEACRIDILANNHFNPKTTLPTLLWLFNMKTIYPFELARHQCSQKRTQTNEQMDAPQHQSAAITLPHWKTSYQVVYRKP